MRLCLVSRWMVLWVFWGCASCAWGNPMSMAHSSWWGWLKHNSCCFCWPLLLCCEGGVPCTSYMNQLYLKQGAARFEAERLQEASMLCKNILATDALCGPSKVVRMSAGKGSVRISKGLALFMNDTGHVIGHFGMAEPNDYSGLLPQMRQMYQRHKKAGLPVRPLPMPGISDCSLPMYSSPDIVRVSFLPPCLTKALSRRQ